MKTIFAAFALCGMAFALSGNAAGQTIIGKWDTVKTFCEGGKALFDFSTINEFRRRVFDKVSTTLIESRPTWDAEHKTDGCALHTKTNYSIINNQFKLGPFLELTSPNCPRLSAMFISLMRFSDYFLKEKYGNDLAKKMIHFGALVRSIKEGTAPPVEFKISDDNQKLWTFASTEESKDLCRGSRYVAEYKRIE